MPVDGTGFAYAMIALGISIVGALAICGIWWLMEKITGKTL